MNERRRRIERIVRKENLLDPSSNFLDNLFCIPTTKEDDSARVTIRYGTFADEK